MQKKNLTNKIAALLRSIERGHQMRAAEMHEWEEKELRNIFAIMVAGPSAGVPAPPVHITLELLPEMEKDVTIMMNRIQTAHDPLGELFSTLDPV